MYRKGDKVVVYSGHANSKGCRTTVDLAIVEAVGEYQLIVRPISSWSKPAVVHVDRCELIKNKFDHPPTVPSPKTGDLVLAWSWKYGDEEIKSQVGTVHSVVYKIDGIFLEVHVGAEIIKVEKNNCIILQSYSKKT